MSAGSRVRQVGWALVLSACMGVLLALTFKVNAVKSEVRLTERRIIAAQQAKLMLETEFQTRASQKQLSDWNAVEFGYNAPRADQYLENERQLASLGAPRGVNAPSPVRVALNQPEAAESGMIEDLFAEDEAPAAKAKGRDARGDAVATASRTLAQRLARPTKAALTTTVAEVQP